MRFNGVIYMSTRVRIIKIDGEHRLYLYRRKIVYKEKKGDKFVTKFVGVSFNALFNSPVISDDIKEKMRKEIKYLS